MTSYHPDPAVLSCMAFQRSLHPTENICGGSHDNALRDETQTWLLTFLSWTCLVYWRQHPSVCWIDNAASCGSHGFVNCLACTVANTSLRNIGRKNCRRKQYWLILKYAIYYFERSQRPRGLRRGSAASRLLGLRFRTPPVAWMSVCCECCLLSGTGICDGPITRPEESYRVWCV